MTEFVIIIDSGIFLSDRAPSEEERHGPHSRFADRFIKIKSVLQTKFQLEVGAKHGLVLKNMVLLF